MNVLILSQEISDAYVEVLKNALPIDCEVDIITGTRLTNHKYIHAPAYNPKSLKNRILCWFNYYAFVSKWTKRNKNSDYKLIFATSNPPINCYLGVKLKKQFQAKFLYMNWDLYPQVIEKTMQGFLPFIISKFWHRINNSLYLHIDYMITIGSIMGKTINKSLKNKLDIHIIPMFTDTQRMKPIIKTNNHFCVQNNIDNKFIVLYSGKMGLGHNFEILLKASKLLAEYKDILFLFIGHGQKYEMIKKWISDEKSLNVKIMPLQSEEIFPLSMACGDVGFISQEKNSSNCFMPAKLYDMMACGMSIVSYSDGNDDLSNLIRQFGIGIAITSDDPSILAKSIEELYLDRALIRQYGVKARDIAVNVFDKKFVIEKYRSLFNYSLGMSTALQNES